MATLFQFFQQNPYLLLFLVVGLSVWIGRLTIKGYGLGMVAAAIVVGAGMSAWASVYGAKLELNNFTKLIFYYLFMYGVGLRVGPSFVNSLKGDGAKFSLLAVVSCVIGLALVVLGVKLFNLPPGQRWRHPCRLANYVGSHRLRRAGCLRDPFTGGRYSARCLRHGRVVLWHHLHLGYGRHHPDLQVSAAMVGDRRARRGEGIRS